MPTYTIFENEQFVDQPISAGLLGANFVTSFDFEIAESAALLQALGSLGISTLRFPGGSVTEDSFTEAAFLTGNWDATSHFDGTNTHTLTPLSSFFEAAGQIGVDVQLVIPTRVAFTQSAGQALNAGEFGTRTELRLDYLDLVDRYIEQALRLAAESGTQITRIEIGNEFWGSGEMSSAEYGFLSGVISAHLAEEFPDLEVFIQIVSSSNAFTPTFDSQVFLEPDGSGDFEVFPGIWHNGPPEDNWIETTIPGIGNSYSSNVAIAESFASVPGAVENLTGAINHVYFGGGMDGIDGAHDHALQTALNRFIVALGAPLELDYLISEWSPRGPNSDGLQYAHTVIEAFFELASNGVDNANFWPVTFANPRTLIRSLIDSIEGDLTFGGVALSWLSEVVGMQAAFDFEVDGSVDLHGYTEDNGMVVFAADRSGNSSASTIHVSLGEFSFSDVYFVTYTHLISDDGLVSENRSDPIVTVQGGITQQDSLLSLDLQPFEVVMIELQAITAAGDRIAGSISDDSIVGGGGDDTIFGGDGNDTLNGEQDDDQLYGENGNDLIRGGWGNDTIHGGQGSDSLIGSFGNDQIFGQSGDDTLFGQDGDDLLAGEGGADVLNGGDGSDHIDGGDGDDVIIGSAGFDTIVGGAGTDELVLSELEHGVYAELSVGNLVGSSIDYTVSEIEHLSLTDEADFVISEGETSQISLAAGNDVLQIDVGMWQPFAQENYVEVYGGAGFDYLSIAQQDVAGTFHLSEGILETQTGEISYAGFEALVGSEMDDRFVGHAGSSDYGQNPSFFGYGGADSFQLFGSFGIQVSAGAGNDYVLMYGSSGFVNLGTGDDRLIGTWQPIFAEGGDGNDEITGSTANDTISGGADDDFLAGGTGADTFQFSTSFGNDTITDFVIEEDFIELLDFNASYTVENLAGGSLVRIGSEGSIFIADVDSLELELAFADILI